MTKDTTEEARNAIECKHHYTFKKEDLYTDVYTIFSKKTCEKCGETIVLSRQSKVRVILFVVILVLALFACEIMAKQILPDVSYAAKGLVLVLLFCIALGFGLYRLMNTVVTYVTYVPPNRPYREAYEKARQENDERTRQRYEEAARKREEKRQNKNNN